MMNVKVTDIHWVCDEEEREELPVNVVVSLTEEQFKTLQDEGPSCQGGLVDMIIDYYQGITGYHLDIYDLEYGMSVEGDENKYIFISLGE